MKKDLSSAYAARKKVGLTSLKTKLKSNESANSIVQGILAKKKKAIEGTAQEIKQESLWDQIENLSDKLRSWLSGVRSEPQTIRMYERSGKSLGPKRTSMRGH